MNILITGANGFIGRALCSRLASGNKVDGVDITGPTDGALNIAWEQADLTDVDSVSAICEKYSSDVVIHCAGIRRGETGDRRRETGKTKAGGRRPEKVDGNVGGWGVLAFE